MLDDDWPAPFPATMGKGLISFEARALREFDRFAADPDAAVPRHLDALYRYRPRTFRFESGTIHYFGSVYRSCDRIYVVWIEAGHALHG